MQWQSHESRSSQERSRVTPDHSPIVLEEFAIGRKQAAGSIRVESPWMRAGRRDAARRGALPRRMAALRQVVTLAPQSSPSAGGTARLGTKDQAKIKKFENLWDGG
ncbi:hypothetical protein Acid7E03_09260 [Acidisoma sp. 7E03]